jgi:ferric-dicitrate binding protein FerR (iron transport regulator)
MFNDLNNKEELTGNSELERKILSRASELEVPSTIPKEEALRRLKLRIENSSSPREMEINQGRKMKWIYSAAASIVVLVGVWSAFSYFGTTNIVAPKGQQTEYRLPDGSMVSINAESKISFRKSSFNKNRFLKLEGEAFFSVKKGSSFVVRTRFADIKVLGTSFNIYSREKSFKVSCVTGKVQVKNAGNDVILTPGESAVSKNNHLQEFADKNITTVSNWRIGQFYFESAPLIDVFKEIERQFNVTFTLPDIDNKFYTGDFSNRDLVDVLDVVCIPMGLKYEIGTNSKIQVRNNSD